MDKDTAKRVYSARMARFVAMQNEIACMAIEFGIGEEAYVSSTRDAYQDMNKAVDTAVEAINMAQIGARISDFIKKATDGSN